MIASTRRTMMSGAAALAATPAGVPSHPAFPPVADSRSADFELLQLDAEMASAIVREDAAWAAVDAFATSDEDDDPLRVLANERMEDVAEIVKRIGKVQAITLEGLLVKLRAVLWCQSGVEFEAENLEMGLGNSPPSTNAVVLATLLNDMAAMGSAAA